jgi:hypothetical protein
MRACPGCCRSAPGSGPIILTATRITTCFAGNLGTSGLRFFDHCAARPSDRTLFSHFLWSVVSTMPMIVSRIGRMPTSFRTLRFKLDTLCLKKNHR